MGLNKDFLGKSYPEGDAWPVTKDATQGYARATNAENPAYFDENRPGGIIAPPMYGVVYTFQQLMTPLFDTELGVNMMRLVHGEQDMRFFAPVRPGDAIRTTAKIVNMQEKVSGELLEIQLTSVNQKGEKVQEIVTGLFIRGRVRGAKKEEEKVEESAPAGTPLFDEKVAVAPDQSLRYADASGDHNPIHKDPDMAKASGLPDIILHGLCTMAFTANAVVEKVAGGDPQKLKRLRVRFAKPVMNGETLTINAWEQGAQDNRRVLALEVYNPQGVVVIKDAVAEVAR